MGSGSRLRTIVYAALLTALLAVTLVVPGCSSSAGETTTTRALAPDFSGVTLDGEQVSLSDYRGMPVVLVFTASWCPYCRAESPEIERFYQENKDRVALLAVAVSDTESDMRAFVRENGLNFPVMLNGDRVARVYRATYLPTKVIVDPEGRIAKRLVGGGTTAEALSLIVDGLAGTR